MKNNIVTDISLEYLAKILVSSYTAKCRQPIKFHDSLKGNILKKK